MDQQRANGPAVDAGSNVTEGFGTMAIEKRAETASTAVAAQAQATIQARYIVAMKSPRDIDTVRSKLMKECRRPAFADVARYHKPVGKGVEGPSIRFAETAIRCMTNIDTQTQAIFDSVEKRIVRVTVSDLESNVAFASDVTIDKTVERSKVPDGMTPIGSRTNSYGKITYILPATDEDLLNKQNALISKAIRTLALRLVPGDLIDEAMEIVLETQRNRDAKDPDSARKRLVDAFVSVGVKPGDLKAYLGHDLDALSPAELAHLRALYAAIRDGEATWKEAYEARHKTAATADGKPAGIKDRVKAKAEAAKTPEPPTAPSSTTRAAPPPDDDDRGDAYEGDEAAP